MRGILSRIARFRLGSRGDPRHNSSDEGLVHRVTSLEEQLRDAFAQMEDMGRRITSIEARLVHESAPRGKDSSSDWMMFKPKRGRPTGG